MSNLKKSLTKIKIFKHAIQMTLTKITLTAITNPMGKNVIIRTSKLSLILNIKQCKTYT